MTTKVLQTHGGSRHGSGRKKGINTTNISFRVSKELFEQKRAKYPRGILNQLFKVWFQDI
jgi:hypothetical protein